MARRTTWACGEKVAMSKPALRRKRAPMGGRLGLLALPAWCRAGQRNEVSVDWAVIRMAWVTEPDSTSS